MPSINLKSEYLWLLGKHKRFWPARLFLWRCHICALFFFICNFLFVNFSRGPLLFHPYFLSYKRYFFLCKIPVVITSFFIFIFLVLSPLCWIIPFYFFVQYEDHFSVIMMNTLLRFGVLVRRGIFPFLLRYIILPLWCSTTGNS